MCMSITVSLKISVTCSRACLQKHHLHVNVLLQMNPAWNGISRRSVSLFPRVRQSRVRSAGSAGWAGSAGLTIKKKNVSLFPRVRQFRVRSAGSADWAGSAGLRISKKPPLAVFRTRYNFVTTQDCCFIPSLPTFSHSLGGER